MKRSETPAEIQQIRKDYINTRWTQLSDSAGSYGEEAVKYLLIVNTAAMGATLGFVGAMPHLRPLMWPKLVLLIFAFGVAILGVYHAVRYHRTEWLFRKWRAATMDYAGDVLEWNDLIDGDQVRSKKLTVLQGLLAYLSLISFYAGLVIAAIHFVDISQPPGGKDVRSQAEQPAASGATATKTVPAPADTGAGPRR